MKLTILLLSTLLLAFSQIVPMASTYGIGSNLSPYCTANNCCSAKTITVNGQASVSGAPDTATITVQSQANALTSNAAINQLAANVARIFTILTANGLSSSNYQTTSLSVYPNTTFDNGVSTVVGQIASQSISITVPDIGNGSKVGRLIDALAAVNGITLNGFTLDIANKTNIWQQARTNAFSNAQKKAQDYSGFAAVSLGKVLEIIDSNSVVNPPSPRPLLFAAALKQSNTATEINVGTISVSYALQIIYAFS